MRIPHIVSLAVLALVRCDPVLAKQPDASEDHVDYSVVCVNANSNQLNQIKGLLKNNRVPYKLEFSFQCPSSESGSKTPRFSLPQGLASWLLKEINVKRIGIASYGLGTAGGSGIYKSAVDRSFFFSGSIDPSSIDRAAKHIECGLYSRFRKNFSEVKISNSCGGSGRTDGLCWTIWVGGHLSNSPGLKPEHLQRKLSNKYWFSAKLQLMLNYVERGVGELDFKDALRMDIYTISSKFVRHPPETPPESIRYKSIGDGASGVEGDSIDELIAQRVEQVVLSSPPICRPE